MSIYSKARLWVFWCFSQGDNIRTCEPAHPLQMTLRRCLPSVCLSKPDRVTGLFITQLCRDHHTQPSDLWHSQPDTLLQRYWPLPPFNSHESRSLGVCLSVCVCVCVFWYLLTVCVNCGNFLSRTFLVHQLYHNFFFLNLLKERTVRETEIQTIQRKVRKTHSHIQNHI